MAETKKATKPKATKSVTRKVVTRPVYLIQLKPGERWSVRLGVNDEGRENVKRVCVEAPCGSEFAPNRDDLRYLCESIIKILDENK